MAEFSRCNKEFCIYNFYRQLSYVRMFFNNFVNLIRNHWLMQTILRVDVSMKIIHNSWCNKVFIANTTQKFSYMRKSFWSPCASWTQQSWQLRWRSPDVWWSSWQRFLQLACPILPWSRRDTRRISPSLLSPPAKPTAQSTLLRNASCELTGSTKSPSSP